MSQFTTFNDEVYKALEAAVNALPEEAIERTSGVDTRKGYDTTGIKYQYLVNILNEVVGVNKWNFTYEKDYEGTIPTKNGVMHELSVDVAITILDATRSHCGGHKAFLHGDAKKGAITSGFKKALGMFGVGKKVYEGTLDDDNEPLPEVQKIDKTEPTDEELAYIDQQFGISNQNTTFTPPPVDVPFSNEPSCPKCGAPMSKGVSKKTGEKFCSQLCWTKK